MLAQSRDHHLQGGTGPPQIVLYGRPRGWGRAFGSRHGNRIHKSLRVYCEAKKK